MVETPRTATVEVGAEPEVPFASRAEAGIMVSSAREAG